ncbi:MAG: Cys-tRNA(Pro) deacylase [Atopobiaceae bacterium]|nr:Cys-tRNA(Pro) deacylase [Atopobiaceae bacterium]MCH4214438.1 Cys-tRNA(Pro) deacylase [Atopobiaceae bacterium]MCH4229368.1 Cys-tRNA(Pro) deacylase [Atopobiaceae bacterium]MCH4276674.1 Cys-tRNA(Pro) deacylase [Atopobiaceae bacterium]MCI1226416.1 Cys-tRNA(Pro) deacylase [Atopobiaceae bacterium]
MSRRQRAPKTNAMRELERGGVPYVLHTYEAAETPGHGLSVEIARSLGQDPDRDFKTLVCVSPAGDHVVCCIPVDLELDLKRAAAAAGEKSLSMMHVADLEPVCGYQRGACSPVGMRKAFPTLIDETAQLFDTICVSGGARGIQLEVAPAALVAFTHAKLADLTQGV